MIKLKKAHIKPASLILAQVFNDNAINAYVFPNPEERMEKMPFVYQFLLRYNFLYGRVFVTSPRLEGVAVWVYSDNLGTSSWRTLVSGAIWPAMKMGREAGRKMQVLDNYVEKKHRELVPTKHWYLYLLGVGLQYQGKGYASKLLNGMLKLIDGEGLPCFLETQGSQNTSMYQHFGFKVIDEFTVPNTPVKLVAMLREPERI